MTQHTGNPVKVKNDEIDMLEVFRTLWSGRLTILITLLIFILAGGGYIIYKTKTSPKEYQSKATVDIESGEAFSGAMIVLQKDSDIDGFVRLTQQEVPDPELVPVIFSSAPFLIRMGNIQLVDPRTDAHISLLNYLDKYTVPPQGNPGAVKGRISAVTGIVKNTVELSVTMQDPNVARQLLDSVSVVLESYFQELRELKAMQRLKVLEYLTDDAKLKYEAACLQGSQDKICDGELPGKNSSFRKSDVIRAGEIYNNLSLKLEQAKILIQNQPGIFRVIEPSSAAVQINKPKILKNILILIVLGGIFGCFLVYLLKFISHVKNNSNSNNNPIT